MDIDYGALFGTGEGEKAQEAAAPAADEATQAQGEEAQEPAEPAGEDRPEGSAGEARAAAEEDEARRETGKQTPEQNAAFAAARRKAEAERDAAIARAQAEAKEEAKRIIDEAFQNSGMLNPYTKKPIQSKEEYDTYRQRFDAERKDRILKKSGISEAEFAAFIDGLPEVRQAREAQKEAERAKKAAGETQARARLEEELKEISGLNPSIRELKDLAGMETYPKLYELVKKGYGLADAYRLANFTALTSSAAKQAQQAAMNNLQSKQHLGQTKERGAGAISVPADVKEMYRALNPGVTDAEIQAHYNRSKRSR